MEKSTSRNIKVGIFVSVAAALLIVGIYIVGRHKNMFGNTFVLNSIFRNVVGLQIGNNVRFSGINVGTVSDVSIISDTTVRVKMIIRQEVKKFIKKDAKATIGSEGLMGNKIISISPGTPSKEPVKHNDYIISVKSTDIDEIIQNLNVTTQNAAIITTDLAEITYKINKGEGAVGKFLFDPNVAKTFERSVKNIEKGTEGFNQNMEALQNNVLLRGHFKKKRVEQAKEEAQRKKEALDKKAD